MGIRLIHDTAGNCWNGAIEYESGTWIIKIWKPCVSLAHCSTSLTSSHPEAGQYGTWYTVGTIITDYASLYYFTMYDNCHFILEALLPVYKSARVFPLCWRNDCPCPTMNIETQQNLLHTTVLHSLQLHGELTTLSSVILRTSDPSQCLYFTTKRTCRREES